MITCGRENPLCLWALWRVETLEAEALWQGHSSRIWLILPSGSSHNILVRPFSCLGFPCSLLKPASLGVAAPLLGPRLCDCAGCLLWTSSGLLASLPWALCIPYIPLSVLSIYLVPFLYCHGLFILVPRFLPSYSLRPPHGIFRPIIGLFCSTSGE